MNYFSVIGEQTVNITAFIPVRGGSKSIPLKNIRLFAGKPLVYWTLMAAVECDDIQEIFVSTDDDRIRECVRSMGLPKVKIIARSKESATDTASTEMSMLEFAEEHEFDYIVLIQATSPLLSAADLYRGIKLLSEADSVLSVVRQKRFVWQDNGWAEPVNYDYNKRPRRQDFKGFLVENGAFYITGREALLGSGCRLSGRIKTLEMPEETYFEIDEPTDWIVAENLLKIRQGLD